MGSNLPKISGTARDGVVEVEAAHRCHPVQMGGEYGGAQMVHLASEVSAHAKIYRGHEALQLVVVGLPEDRNHDSDALRFELPHQEDLGFPIL